MTNRHATGWQKIGISTILVAGLMLLAYGLFFHQFSVRKGPLADNASGMLIVPEDFLQIPESVLVKDVTVGGVVRLPSSILQRTYGGEQKPEQRCPT